MTVLNQSQFPAPGDKQEFGGVEHHFAGWHASSAPDFKIDPRHEHEENMMGAEPGDLYVSHEPQFWAEPGYKHHVHEIWTRKPAVTEHTDEDLVLPEHQPRVGRSYEFNSSLLNHAEGLYEKEFGSRPSRAPKWSDLA